MEKNWGGGEVKKRVKDDFEILIRVIDEIVVDDEVLTERSNLF